MKMKSIFTLISALSLVLLAGTASADVAGYTSNIKAQTVEKATTKWLDLYTANGNQITKRCFFKKGQAAVFLSAETGHVEGPNGGLKARIWLDPVGPPPAFWLKPASGDLFLTAYDGSRAEAHATHGGFFVPSSRWYNVRVQVRSTGQSVFNIDEVSLICMN